MVTPEKVEKRDSPTRKIDSSTIVRRTKAKALSKKQTTEYGKKKPNQP